jgi:hypothetical protein
MTILVRKGNAPRVWLCHQQEMVVYTFEIILAIRFRAFAVFWGVRKSQGSKM